MYGIPLPRDADVDAVPLHVSRSAAVARTANKAATLLIQQDTRFILPSRTIRDAMLVGFAKRRRVLYGAAYDLIRVAEPLDLSDPDAIAENIVAIQIIEIKSTSQAKIGMDLKGYFFNITSAEMLVAQALGDQYRFVFVNIATQRWQELSINEIMARARAIYPAFHIKL